VHTHTDDARRAAAHHDDLSAIANSHFSDALNLFRTSEDVRDATTIAGWQAVERHQVNHGFSVEAATELGAVAIETQSHQSADSRAIS
jgi:hypothetical protein